MLAITVSGLPFWAETFLTNDLSTPGGHDIQTVHVQGGEAKELGDSLKKHGDDGNSYAALSGLNSPAIDEHADGNNSAHEGKGAAEAVLRYSMTALVNVLFDDSIGPATGEEGAKEIAGSWA
jgi:hypothetical protein